MSCLRNAIESYTALSRDWRVESAGISQWLVSVSFQKWSQTRSKVQKVNCRPDYILERIYIFGVDFENFAVSWSKLDPNVYIGEASSNNAPEGHDKISSFTADKMVWYVPPNAYEASMYHCGTWFWLKHLLGDWFVWRRTSYLSSQKGQITLKCSVNFAFPKIHFICCPEFWKDSLKA